MISDDQLANCKEILSEKDGMLPESATLYLAKCDEILDKNVRTRPEAKETYCEREQLNHISKNP